MSNAEVATVVAFNDAINARDLEALGQLMHEQHRLIDPDGTTVIEGKAACINAWRRFFEGFPDYRNVFDEITVDPTGAVQVRGRSECSVPDLHGPARWRAEVEDGLVLVWQVSVPEPET